MNPTYLYIFLLAGLLTACEGRDVREDREGELDPNEIVEQSPDYEDGGGDYGGGITYEEQSPHSEVTAGNVNYTYQKDSILGARDTLVDPKYTDDEYEPAYSTSTTNPRNQVEGGITPGRKN